MTDEVGDAKRWAWESDALTKDIVHVLQNGEACDTRDFLKPLFKWMKAGVRKHGQTDKTLVEKAFAFVDWMVLVSKEGDIERGIPKLDALQPAYALNTLVTSSQRAGSLPEAQRAFDLLVEYGYEPDVFTYTALIDVLARNQDVRGAIVKYEEMKQTKTKPNIVTFTTIIRAISFSDELDPSECLRFLTEAREEETFDEALFIEALDMCAKRQTLTVAEMILQEVLAHGAVLRDSERLIRVLMTLVVKREDKAEVLTAWRQRGLVTELEASSIEKAKAHSVRQNGTKALGCLGQDTSDTVRRAVSEHGINRLVERLSLGEPVSTNDFETLLHQCRKRKWKEEIGMTADAMRTLAAEGWTYRSVEGEETCLPPQPHLAPTSKTYVSIVDAYLACGDEPLAWEAFQEVGRQPELRREQALYRKYIRGCYLLTECTHIQEMLRLANTDMEKLKREADSQSSKHKLVFTRRMCVELVRMHGYRHMEGVDIIVNQLPGDISHEKKQHFFEELITSCAYKHNTSGVVETLEALTTHGFRRSAQTEMAVFICCLQFGDVESALKMLHDFQSKGLALKIPVYNSLLREMYFKYTRRGGSFDDSSRGVAMRTLQSRSALFQQAIAEQEALEGIEDEGPEHTSSQDEREWELLFWCEQSSLKCAPLMFTQHVVEVITTIRDKESKIIAERVIRCALCSTSDPVLFNLRAVMSLRFLDMTYRAQAKLAKQMLTLLSNGGDEVPAIESHHKEFCFDQLNQVTVHIFKELDDALDLHLYDAARVLAFCMDALEKDNVDKTIGFLVNKEALYTLEYAEFLMPKLAEVYVVHGVIAILQFFKPEVEYSVVIRRRFVREVMDLENTLNDEDDDEEGEGSDDESSNSQKTMRYTWRAIVEFKLQHEAEFLPFMMQYKLKVVYADADAPDQANCGVEYLESPLSDDAVVIVDDEDSVALAYEILTSDEVHRIGIDAEWRPDMRGYSKSKCSVLQIACDSSIFLFDLLAVSITDLEELFVHLFASSSIVKLGFALDGDIKRLQWSFPDTKCFDKVENVVDFYGFTERNTPEGAAERRHNKGLSALVHETLGRPLNKRMQKSDWEKRPMSKAQTKYAALDAYCLLLLHNKLCLSTT
ncbi:hypothetical protein Poli38472_005263 [Pythium oligandrum]|uniref:3'-5' exonuclease domain-containing protein n=1 Tax=Pythium oligandrum TaxID=41045 RepID=A0A8K1CH67_PYTOL|nr:hypothetical protein Poli38472_005263 [Pythium oligandrum]|eukprot:TMW62645.1 hypothetical protein Poli38472_005263 [Pythium oligandrum]